MPVLSIGGEESLGNQLGAQMQLVADNVTVIVLKTLVIGFWRNGPRKQPMRW